MDSIALIWTSIGILVRDVTDAIVLSAMARI
jgi:hypothetical protein